MDRPLTEALRSVERRRLSPARPVSAPSALLGGDVLVLHDSILKFQIQVPSSKEVPNFRFQRCLRGWRLENLSFSLDLELDFVIWNCTSVPMFKTRRSV